MNKKQLTIFVVACSITLATILSIYLISKRNQDPGNKDIIINEEVLEEKKKETAVFETYIRLTPEDTSFVLFKESPSFIFVGDFSTDAGYESAKMIEKLNEKYGFSNMAFVLDLADSKFTLDEEGSIEFGDIYIPTELSIIMIYEGKIVSSYAIEDKSYEKLDEYISQFYELNDENVTEEN